MESNCGAPRRFPKSPSEFLRIKPESHSQRGRDGLNNGVNYWWCGSSDLQPGVDVDRFEVTLEGVIISVEADSLTIEQAKEMLLNAFPEKRVDIYKGLRRALEERD